MTARRKSEIELPQIAPRLLDWYDRNRRKLPWRAAPGERQDPYLVWLSEIMLQQTTVAAVTGYFQDFLDRWPTVEDLAHAPLEDILHAWQGLGYYARARNLHKCARQVVDQFGGRFPEMEEELRGLPGIGPYTAAAIAAIAFDRPASAVDGNVERAVARLFAIEEPLPGSKPVLRDLAATLVPGDRPGDFAQAMMDLGATVCTPRNPSCGVCPLSGFCEARLRGVERTLPARERPAARPVRHGIAFCIRDESGALWLRRRPESGLLGGMTEFPSSPWTDTPWDLDEAVHALGLDGADELGLLPGDVRHTFTHFHLVLRVAHGRAGARLVDQLGGRWEDPAGLGHHALPTLMKKVARHAMAGERNSPARKTERSSREG